jgi:hypothetical protein
MIAAKQLRAGMVRTRPPHQGRVSTTTTTNLTGGVLSVVAQAECQCSLLWQPTTKRACRFARSPRQVGLRQGDDVGHEALPRGCRPGRGSKRGRFTPCTRPLTVLVGGPACGSKAALYRRVHRGLMSRLARDEEIPWTNNRGPVR